MELQHRRYVPPAARTRQQRVHQTRQTQPEICPAQFWSWRIDKTQHKADWESGKQRHEEAKVAYKQKAMHERLLLDLPHPRTPPIPFGGRPLHGNRSAVLLMPTIFCLDWTSNKALISPWPNKEELEYDGQGRIATDTLHRRFPPMPRVAGNSTVNWQQRREVPQHKFDNFNWSMDDVEIFLRLHNVPDELEVTENEAERLLGKEMMGMLDPQDQWV